MDKKTLSPIKSKNPKKEQPNISTLSIPVKDNSKEEDPGIKYLKDNYIEEITTDMMNSVILSQTNKPIEHMIKYLAGLMTKEERERACFEIPDPYPVSNIVKHKKVEEQKNVGEIKKIAYSPTKKIKKDE